MKIPDGVSGIFLVAGDKAIVGRRRDCCLGGDRQTGQVYRLPLLFLHWEQCGIRLGVSSLLRSDSGLVLSTLREIRSRRRRSQEEVREKRKRSEHENEGGGGFSYFFLHGSRRAAY